MKRILLGTRNITRKEYVNEIVKDLPVHIVSLDDLGIEIKAVENGKNPIENSLKKALTYYRQSKMPTLSIDSGLFIDKFPEHKQPGVFVKRINGRDEATDEEMLEYYINELNKYGGESNGCWKIAITLVLTEDKIYTTTFDKEALFTSKKCNEFSVDEPLNSIQIEYNTNKYLAQMTVQEKKETQNELASHIFGFVESNISKIK